MQKSIKGSAMGKSDSRRPSTHFTVSLEERPDYQEPLAAVVFDSVGNLLDQAKVKDGKVKVDLPAQTLMRSRVFIVPLTGDSEKAPTLEAMERLGAYQAIVAVEGKLTELIRVPGAVIDFWPACSCYVHGQVVRSSDNRKVCGARVHICEVDKLPRWILRLPEDDLFRLRDDLLDVIRRPPIPLPGPFPRPPLPDPPPLHRPVFRFAGAAGPSPELKTALPRTGLDAAAPQQMLSAQRDRYDLQLQLLTPSAAVLRDLLVVNASLIYPWFCLWPHWWWRLQCDEVAVVSTDVNGRFQAVVHYPCLGDHPDLYFWVEYDFGSGFESVYHPPIACHTYWDYLCGSEVTIRVSDPRVPSCSDEPDLPGCQVVVLSIGNRVAVRELQTSAAGATREGLTAGGEPFGATLEPRVDFSRSELIDNKNIPFYRWSYRRLSGPDGVSTAASVPASVPISTAADAASAPAGDWTPLTRSVVRHYKDGTSYPADPMGPLPTSGPPPTAPIENLFRIRPANPPVGTEWRVLNEHVDLATAYFETASLTGSPASGPVDGSPPVPAPDDLAAGRYELKLELFDQGGNLVNWTDKGVDLRITVQDAPFGSGTITTVSAPTYNRILSGGKTIGFKMVVRVDNNHCYAEVLPLAGDVTPDPLCGFHTYAPGDKVRFRFVARHPNQFANYAFNSFRATGPALAVVATAGVTGAAGTSGYAHVGGFQYEKDVAVAALMGSCANAAFAKRLDVEPLAQNGYTRLHYLRHADTAAFALAQPCPPCVCDE